MTIAPLNVVRRDIVDELASYTQLKHISSGSNKRPSEINTLSARVTSRVPGHRMSGDIYVLHSYVTATEAVVTSRKKTIAKLSPSCRQRTAEC